MILLLRRQKIVLPAYVENEHGKGDVPGWPNRLRNHSGSLSLSACSRRQSCRRTGWNARPCASLPFSLPSASQVSPCLRCPSALKRRGFSAVLRRERLAAIARLALSAVSSEVR